MKKMKGTSDSHPAFDLRHPDIVCPEQIVPGSVQELGFLYGGPAALGFLNWITEQAQRDRIDHILFLSPDGYIPERFARLCSGSNNSRLPPFHYFYGSSIFFILTAIFEYNFTEFLPLLLSDSKGLSPGELLERIGVPKPSEKVMNDLIVHDDSINTDVQDEFLTKFFYAFRSEILKICRKNRRALFFYLKSLGIQPANRVAIVDIGWNGINQTAFELALKNIMEISVFGYHFCLADTPKHEKDKHARRMSAFISSDFLSKEEISILYDNRTGVELFFSAPHRPVIGLEVTNDRTMEIVEDNRNRRAHELTKFITDIVEGIELFSSSYEKVRKQTQFPTSHQKLAMPLIEFVIRTEWKKHDKIAMSDILDNWSFPWNCHAEIDSFLTKMIKKHP